jgi:hypothetical protein
MGDAKEMLLVGHGAVMREVTLGEKIDGHYCIISP